MTPARHGGVVIGRFMPPHAGHQYLIEFARSYTRNLTVFVCTLSHELIPGELRFAWMRRLFPHVRLVHVTEEIPQASRSAAGAQAIWAQAIRSRLQTDPRYVFASEDYGHDLAAALGAEYVPVDPRRTVFPVSAGAIRDDPFGNWGHIPHVVRPYFARKIALAEPSGTLAEELARSYDTLFATDYPAYLRSIPAQDAAAGKPAALARAQSASEEALLLQTNRILFTAADPLRILTEAGVAPAERDRIMAQLMAGHPYLAPSLVVAVEPVDESYRDALQSFGWPLACVRDREEARRRCAAQLEEWLGPHSAGRHSVD